MFVIVIFLFFFNDTATTEIYTLSLHDALPISRVEEVDRRSPPALAPGRRLGATGRHARHRLEHRRRGQDRKSTRLNSSHGYISYAVFCLKKKKKKNHQTSAKLTNRTEQQSAAN